MARRRPPAPPPPAPPGTETLPDHLRHLQRFAEHTGRSLSGTHLHPTWKAYRGAVGRWFAERDLINERGLPDYGRARQLGLLGST